MNQKPRGGSPALLVWGTIALAAFLLSACGGGNRPNPELQESDWEVRVESPLDTVDVVAGEASDPIVDAIGDAEVSAENAPPERPADPEPVSVPDPRDFAPGWRVQIAALSSMATAEEAAEVARSRFREPVYVEYEPPLYKVRVGDFMTREEAESMVTRAHAQDYEKAWVVETLVLKPAR